MDKQFETPLSSRSNIPHSESGFTSLFLSSRGELNSSHPSSPSAFLSRSGPIGNGLLPTACDWIGPASGPRDVPATGLENPPLFLSTLYLIRLPLQTLPTPPPENLET
jgi:hypothetical protein